VPVGVTCRSCERTDCEQRAFPSLRQPLAIDENVRGLSLYVSVPEAESPRHAANSVGRGRLEAPDSESRNSVR
jgi:hypothetical protein